MLNPTQQAFELIKKSKEILVALPANAGGDAIGSALALNLALKKMDKIVTLSCSSTLPTKFAFLPDAEKFISKIDAPRVFELLIVKNGSKISQVKYENTDAALKFFLTTQGIIDPKDIILKPSRFIYDLIISADSPDLESIGEIYNQNSELFFNTPILNIDYKSANDQFGEANLIDLNASSVSEIIFSLIESMGSGLFDQNIATALMTGVISKTKNFRHHTNPKIFLLASSLANFGANQTKITNSLFEQKSMASVKLVGQALANDLEFNEEKKSVLAVIADNNPQSIPAAPKDINAALNDLIDFFSDCSTKAFLYAGQDKIICGLVSSNNAPLLEKIKTEFGGKIKNGDLVFKTEHLNIQDIKTGLSNLIFN